MAIPAPAIHLTPEDKQKIEEWIASRHTPERVAVRARILLEAASGKANSQIASLLGITRPTVLQWRRRYQEAGLDALLDKGLSDGGSRICRDTVQVVLKAMKAPPPNGRPWSIREMAKVTGLSPTTIHRVWRTQDIRHHLLRFLPLVNDTDFASRFLGITGYFSHPPYHAVILASVPSPLLSQPTCRIQPDRDVFFLMRTHEALRAQEGYFTHTSIPFRTFLDQSCTAMKKEWRYHLITDLGRESSGKALASAIPGDLHWTALPDEGLWFELMRGWLQLMVVRSITDGRFGWYNALIQAYASFLEAEEPDPFVWVHGSGTSAQKGTAPVRHQAAR